MLLWLTVPMYTKLSITEHTISCCYCWLHPCRVRYSFLRGLDNIAQENTTADILLEDQLWSPLDMIQLTGRENTTNQIAEPSKSIRCGTNHQDKLSWRYVPTNIVSFFLLSFFTWSRNWVVMDVLEHLDLLVLKLWWEDLLYASYDEGTYSPPVMMRGRIVWQLRWGSVLFASYDEGVYCKPVMYWKIEGNKNKQRRTLKIILRFSTFFPLPFYYLREEFKACLELVSSETTI